MKILKKTHRFCFDFLSLKLKKPNRTQTKNPSQPEKTEPNLELVFVLKTKPKPVGLNRFWFFKFGLVFFDKNQTEPKMMTLKVAGYMIHEKKGFKVKKLNFTLVFMLQAY